ncbi:hypothetical protein [Cytobacillus oceanisediminis]|uniref:hypothetical protein n=1 Tax=Cytobacillus oceanisediminis TaxID=665099 RepID=UPI002041252B|nr:hypothetical protein [Cytobacillus oceanisediminis]MCM3405501.1 hypothetical protein [Cytobacillus oceanisediminis]
MSKIKTFSELELILLNIWHDNGIKEVYKYKNRIKAFREPLVNLELINDLSCGEMFADIEDIANHRDALPEDYKIDVKSLIENRICKTQF